MTSQKIFRFVNAHLPASKKGELANQNAAYKIIALEYLIKGISPLTINFCSEIGRKYGSLKLLKIMNIILTQPIKSLTHAWYHSQQKKHCTGDVQ